MEQAIAKQWVEALRSGEYKQADGQLRSPKGFCCLGVLCNLHAQAHPEIAAKETSPYAYLGGDMVLPEQVMNWAGVTYELGFPRYPDAVVIGDGIYSSLAKANDHYESFADIADWIEKNYKDL